VVSLTPASGSGTRQTFSAQFDNLGGGGAINATLMLITSGFVTQNACYVYLNRDSNASNGFYLMNDAATAFIGPVAVGAAGTLQNSQCTLNVDGSSVGVSGTTLTVNMLLTFTASFAGNKSVYLYGSTAAAKSPSRIAAHAGMHRVNGVNGSIATSRSINGRAAGTWPEMR
jgi:hypothetical protein